MTNTAHQDINNQREQTPTALETIHKARDLQLQALKAITPSKQQTIQVLKVAGKALLHGTTFVAKHLANFSVKSMETLAHAFSRAAFICSPLERTTCHSHNYALHLPTHDGGHRKLCDIWLESERTSLWGHKLTVHSQRSVMEWSNETDENGQSIAVPHTIHETRPLKILRGNDELATELKGSLSWDEAQHWLQIFDEDCSAKKINGQGYLLGFPVDAETMGDFLNRAPHERTEFLSSNGNQNITLSGFNRLDHWHALTPEQQLLQEEQHTDMLVTLRAAGAFPQNGFKEPDTPPIIEPFTKRPPKAIDGEEHEKTQIYQLPSTEFPFGDITPQ